MNKEVQESLLGVIKAWKTGERKYAFESRGFANFMMSPIIKGEVLMRFHINIDGFFEDEQYSKPINLSYSSGMFETLLLSQEKPENPQADAIKLKDFLEKFTLYVYSEVNKIVSSYSQVFTIEQITME